MALKNQQLDINNTRSCGNNLQKDIKNFYWIKDLIPTGYFCKISWSHIGWTLNSNFVINIEQEFKGGSVSGLSRDRLSIMKTMGFGVFFNVIGVRKLCQF